MSSLSAAPEANSLCNICFDTFDNESLIHCEKCTFQLCQECFDHDLDSCPQCRAPARPNIKEELVRIVKEENWDRRVTEGSEGMDFQNFKVWFDNGWNPKLYVTDTDFSGFSIFINVKLFLARPINFFDYPIGVFLDLHQSIEDFEDNQRNRISIRELAEWRKMYKRFNIKKNLLMPL